MDKIRYVKKLYRNSFKDEVINVDKIKPLNTIYSVDDNALLGENLIKDNKLGIIIFSGGDATRLGKNKAKGLVELKYKNKNISIFEIFIIKLKNIYKKYNVYLNIYFMTSKDNNESIISFFEDNNYFNYPENNIKFFMQESLPIVDVDGNILYKSKDEILEGPNGNGDVFRSMKKNGILDDIKSKNIEYLVFSTIDNIMLKLVDVDFFGTVLKNKYELASKSISKESIDDKNWVFIKYKNHPYMLPSKYITDDMFENKTYIEKNITYHFIKTSLVEKICNKKLPYHRNYKSYNYYDSSKNKIVLSKDKNSFKFEKYVFDGFYYGKDMLLYSVKKDEFMPIKIKEDLKKVEEKLKEINLDSMV